MFSVKNFLDLIFYLTDKSIYSIMSSRSEILSFICCILLVRCAFKFFFNFSFPDFPQFEFSLLSVCVFVFSFISLRDLFIFCLSSSIVFIKATLVSLPCVSEILRAFCDRASGLLWRHILLAFDCVFLWSLVFWNWKDCI